MRNNFFITVARIAVVYVALALCRILFFAVNADMLGPVEAGDWGGIVAGSLRFDSASVCYAFSLFVLLSLLPLRCRTGRAYQAMLFVVWLLSAVVTVVLNTADAIYFRGARKRFTFDDLHFLQDGDNNGAIVLKALGENISVIALALLFIIGMVAAYRRLKVDPATEFKSPALFYPVNTALLALAVFLAVGAIRGGYPRTTRPITLSNAAEWVSSPSQSALVLSNPFCVIRTAGNKTVSVTEFFASEVRDSIFSPYHKPVSVGGMSRRNIVLFVLESFSREHSALLNPGLYDNGGYTPFLDSLMGHSLLFTNAYSSGRKSIDALPSIMASIPSYVTPFVLTPQALGRIDGLPALLGREGYRTDFFCGSPRSSMGFVAFCNHIGVENHHTQEDYEKACGTDDFDGFWGIRDRQFLGYMARVIDTLPQPFFASVFTLSSHHPFIVPDDFDAPEGFTKEHPCVAYTDDAIRRFFDHARTQPWFESTLFVFCADHVSSEIYADKTRTATGSSAIIYFVYDPLGQGRVHDGVTGQLDIMPTLLGLLGYDKPYFAFGRDVLGESDRPAMATNYYNERYLFITDSLSYLFDGNRITAAYDYKRDSLELSNIFDRMSPEMQRADSLVKAYHQSYYTHLKEMDFTAE
ncbi:MAG: sulfatase-like hydrolase/transferase [Rikenellaceae bacterium]|nr:sulfatase-like hydrolase/transferase [Rikenellaceae bacterium]